MEPQLRYVAPSKLEPNNNSLVLQCNIIEEDLMVTSIPVVESSLTTPRVRIVSFDQPWEWLAAGWKDLWRAPIASIPYGLLYGTTAAVCGAIQA